MTILTKGMGAILKAAKKKALKVPRIKKTYIISHKGPVMPIEEYAKKHMDPKTMMGRTKKRTLH